MGRHFVGNFTLKGVRKIRNGKLHHPPYSSSSKYVLITHNAHVFQSELYKIKFRAFLKKISLTKEQGKLLIDALPFLNNNVSPKN